MRLTTYTNYSLRIEETIDAISDMLKLDMSNILE